MSIWIKILKNSLISSSYNKSWFETKTDAVAEADTDIFSKFKFENGCLRVVRRRGVPKMACFLRCHLFLHRGVMSLKCLEY
jgi:hypothetical protein